ncbi:hypothetical protein C8R43DRAFT_1136777 [Mycena crocata]|nr:hypothetical protein C8R43DRAFT_1136777 [Mycena crocata]
MSSHAAPNTLETAALQFPSPSFFYQELANEAAVGIGEVHTNNLNLSIQKVQVAGCAYVYRTSPRDVRVVQRAFVYGEVVSIEHHTGKAQGSLLPVQVQLVSLKCPTGCTENPSITFANDVVGLWNLTHRERGRSAMEQEQWLKADISTPKGGIITVLCVGETNLKAGPVHVGDIALFDVSLHRYDTYSTSFESVYSLAAHSAEVVSKEFLIRCGCLESVAHNVVDL